MKTREGMNKKGEVMKYCNTGVINCKDCWDWDKDRCKVNLYNPNDKVAEAIATRDKE